jgi:5-methylcytosine-specific restriction protein A
METVLSKLRVLVAPAQVEEAIAEYDRMGPDSFFAAHGYGPSRTYELEWKGKRYPHKAVLGRAYELATGDRLQPGDFEGGKAGAVAVLEQLGFTVVAKG